MADEMTYILNTTMLNSVDKKIFENKFNYIIINQAVIKCLNKPRKLLQFIENLPHLLIKILHWASHKIFNWNVIIERNCIRGNHVRNIFCQLILY